MTASMKGRRGPRPSHGTAERHGEVAATEEQPDCFPEQPPAGEKKEKRRLSFNEVYRHGRATHLGLLPLAKMKKLTATAMDEPEPLAFIDAQAAAMEEAVEANDATPEFPVSGAIGQPKHRAVCTTRKEHADVHTWRIRNRNKKDCVCHVCGATWVQ